MTHLKYCCRHCHVLRSTPLTCITAIGHAFRIRERCENESLGPSASVGKARNFQEPTVTLSVLFEQQLRATVCCQRIKRLASEIALHGRTAFRNGLQTDGCVLYMRSKHKHHRSFTRRRGISTRSAAAAGFRDREKREERRRDCQLVRSAANRHYLSSPCQTIEIRTNWWTTSIWSAVESRRNFRRRR